MLWLVLIGNPALWIVAPIGIIPTAKSCDKAQVFIFGHALLE